MCKYLFIDSNVIIKEFLEAHRVESLGQELLKILDNDQDLFLIMPEIISDELHRELKNKQSAISQNLKSSIDKIAGIDDTLRQELLKQSGRVIESNSNQLGHFLTQLLEHKRVIQVKISERLIMSSIIRQVKRQPPSVKNEGKKDSARPIDHDTLAFESVIQVLQEYKASEFICCTDDGDYFLNRDKCILKPFLEKELRDHCMSLMVYTDPWTMLQTSFGSSIIEPQPRRPRFWDYKAVEKRKISTPVPGSIICGETLSSLYWYSDTGERFTFPTGDILYSWFPETSAIPPVYQVTDETLASITLAGNIVYRPGTRLIKIESDEKIYAIDIDGLIRWIPNEDTISELYGRKWKDLLVVSPDVLFLDYSIGNTIENANDFDPEQAKINARLP